jgi:hypothetical protein
VTVKGINTLADSEKHLQPDANSKSALLGLDGTKDITLEDNHLSDVPQRALKSK